MAFASLVSLPQSERELWNWLQTKIAKKEISPSLIWRDRLKELKKQDDIADSVNVRALNDRINDLKNVVGNFSSFIEKKKLNEDWFKFNDAEMQKEVFARKGIETIEIDNSKKPKIKDEPN